MSSFPNSISSSDPEPQDKHIPHNHFLRCTSTLPHRPTNSKTGVSTFDKPDELKTVQERHRVRPPGAPVNF